MPVQDKLVASINILNKQLALLISLKTIRNIDQESRKSRMLKWSWKGIILSTQVCFVVTLFRVSKPCIDISREISKELSEK